MEPVAPLWPARFFLCGPSFSAGSHFYAANILIAYQMRYRIIYISILANVAAGDMYILWFIHEWSPSFWKAQNGEKVGEPAELRTLWVYFPNTALVRYCVMESEIPPAKCTSIQNNQYAWREPVSKILTENMSDCFLREHQLNLFLNVTVVLRHLLSAFQMAQDPSLKSEHLWQAVDSRPHEDLSCS